MTEEDQTLGDPLVGGDFQMFVTRLSFQGFLALGLLENPITKDKRVHPEGARMVLDDLVMLREKTLGRLDVDEDAHLVRVIQDLSRGLEKISGSSPEPADG